MNTSIVFTNGKTCRAVMYYQFTVCYENLKFEQQCAVPSFKILMFYQRPKTSSHWKLNKKKRKQRMMNLNNRERQSLLKLFKLKKRENLLTLEDRNRWVILTKLLKSLVIKTTTILTSSIKQLCGFFWGAQERFSVEFLVWNFLVDFYTPKSSTIDIFINY